MNSPASSVWPKARVAFVLSLCLAATALGGDLRALAEYRPTAQVSGTIRSWGSRQMSGLMKRWEEGFRKVQPGVVFSDKLMGTASAQFGIQLDVADLALMNRQAVPYDLYGVWRRSHRLPVQIEVATGSFNVPGKANALAVFVHKSNPLTRLTLKQLDGIFGAQRTGGWDGMEWNIASARSEKDDIRVWGQLGLTGEWADKPIHAYGPPGIGPGGLTYFQLRVLGGADTWCEGLREFADRREMVNALARDPYGIGYTGIAYANTDVKPVALAEHPGGDYVELTKTTVEDRTYPLTRPIYIYFAPDLPNGDTPDPKVDPKVREFLRYILSRQGQEDVAREGDYLPLTAKTVTQQLQKLE